MIRMNYFDDTYDLVCRPEKAPPRAQKKSLPAAFPQGEALFVSVHSTQFRCAFSHQTSDILPQQVVIVWYIFRLLLTTSLKQND